MTEEYKSVLTLVTSEFKKAAKEASGSVKDVKDQLDSTKKISPFSETVHSAREATKEVKGLTTVLRNVAGALGLAFGVKAVLQFGAACTEAGAEMQAAGAQFTQIFGSMRDQAEESLSAIAGEAGSTANSMRSDFNQLAAFAKVGGMDTADALSLAERGLRAAADSAAFYDRNLSDVTENLRSFLKGNYENDAALGLSCTETTRNAAANALYGKSFKDLNEAQKQLTLLKMVEDANKASGALGQAARESQSWTTQTRLLKDQAKEFMGILGTGLIAVLTPVLQFANNLLGVLIRVANTVGTILSNLFGIHFDDMAPTEDLSLAAEVTEEAADATDHLADSTGNAADAAKDLGKATKDAAAAQRSLLGFDKITKLTAAMNSGSGSGGNGGGSGGGSGGGGDTAADNVGPVSSIVPKAADDVLSQTERKIGDWAKRLRDLIGGIWDALMDLLDHLPDIELPDLKLSPTWDKSIQKVKDDIKNSTAELTVNFFDIDQKSVVVNVELAQKDWSTVGDYVHKHSGFSGGGGSLENGYRLPLLVELVKNNWENLKDWATGKKNAIEATVELVKKDWNTVSGWVKDSIGGGVSKAIELAKDGWKSVSSWVRDSIGGGVSKAVSLTKDGWKSVGGWVRDSLGKSVSLAVNLVKGWKGKAAKALGLDKLSSTFKLKLPKVSVTWSGRPIPLPHFHVKWNAKGGILDGAQLFGMAGSTLLGGGERGREAVLPLESNTGWMDTLADKVAARVGGQGGSNQPIRVQVVLDGKVVAESTVRQLRNQARGGNYPLAGLV